MVRIGWRQREGARQTAGVSRDSRADDDAVIRAAKAGDPLAWRSLYADVDGRLVGWLRSQQSSDAAIDADDVASEAWMTAARRIAEFSGTADDFAGWIFVIARNIRANAHRRGVRRATHPTDADPRLLVRTAAPDDTEAVDAADWIRRTLAILSDRERDVVAAIDIAGLDIAAGGRLLSMSRTAVRSAHYRARRRLAARLEEEARSRRPWPAEPRRLPRAVARLTTGDD
jgi:RNA polymerase sigma-70 factor, ECF subfamily